MSEVIHFNMIVEINHLLKDKGIDYSIHSIGGCSSCGVELRCIGNKYPIDKLLTLINEYLSDKWIKVIPEEDNSLYLKVVSNFR